MTARPKKGIKSSIDDLLSGLLDDDDDIPIKARAPAREPSRQGASLPSRSGKSSLLDDDFFSKLAEEAKNDDEQSDVSEADPIALLESMKDMDDMEADLFRLRKKPGSAPVQSSGLGGGARRDAPKPVGKMKGGSGEAAVEEERKISSAPEAGVRGYKKFSFTAPAVPKKRDELTFDDDGDDLMETLGIGEKSAEPPQRARTRLDEILGRGTSPRLLERPPTGEKTSNAKDTFLEDDLTFGSYQPTLAATSEGRQSRRQSVRFSTEDVSTSSPEKPKPSAISSSRSHAGADWLGLKLDGDDDHRGVRGGGSGEGGRGVQEEKFVPAIPSSLSLERRTSLPTVRVPPAAKPVSETATPTSDTPTIPTSATSSRPPRAETGPPSNRKEEVEEKDDWLLGALNRKKSQAVAVRAEEQRSRQEEFLGLGEEVDLDSFLSKPGSSPASRRRQEGATSMPAPPRPTPRPTPSTALAPEDPPSPAHHSAPAREDLPRLAAHPSQNQTNTPATHYQILDPPGLSAAVHHQVQVSADSLQLLLQQQLVQSQLSGLGGAVAGLQTQQLGGAVAGLQRQQLGGAVAGLQRQQQVEQLDLQILQDRIVHLEAQVRAVQQERDQTRMFLENVQQRHQQDTERMENTHRAAVRLLEEAGRQQGLLAQQQREELLTQQQLSLARAQQEAQQEVERLRQLQRKSVEQMKKEQEEEVARLKRLKDVEIEAVTSATSHSRTMAEVMEQMGQFVHTLGSLSSRVESTHTTTTQGLEEGSKVVQSHLQQQQRAMEQERARLQELVTKMDARLGQQQRQLEQERWKVSEEQAKAESSQRAVEEERRSLTQHLAMEREELDRAKTALLEEQKQVMRSCAEERRRLAEERSLLQVQEKERRSREERENSRALERHAHREEELLRMAQERAELTLRAAELVKREESVTREREELQRQKEELQRQKEELEKEKERMSSTALRLKTRAQEVEAYSKLASEQYAEGERALQEARHVELDHQTRLRTVHTQLDTLRRQETHLTQERMKMTTQCNRMERLRTALPLPPLSPLPSLPHSLPPTFTTDFSPVLATPLQPSTTLFAPPLTLAPPTPGDTELQARVALLRHTAEKDRDFLEEEQFFLDALKKAPYNSAFHTH